MTPDKTKKPYSEVMVKLYMGAVYAVDNRHQWDTIVNYQDQIRDHLGTIGLELIISDVDSLAFIRQKTQANDEHPLPGLIEKRKLSYRATLLIVLLAEKLYELDMAAGDAKLVMRLDEIRDMMRMFLPEQKNEASILDRLDESISKLASYGYLRKVEDEKYEVMRLIKYAVSADKLLLIKGTLNHNGSGKSKHS